LEGGDARKGEGTGKGKGREEGGMCSHKKIITTQLARTRVKFIII